VVDARAYSGASSRYFGKNSMAHHTRTVSSRFGSRHTQKELNTSLNILIKVTMACTECFS